jgi:hypothetical protein
MKSNRTDIHSLSFLPRKNLFIKKNNKNPINKERMYGSAFDSNHDNPRLRNTDSNKFMRIKML